MILHRGTYRHLWTEKQKLEETLCNVFKLNVMELEVLNVLLAVDRLTHFSSLQCTPAIQVKSFILVIQEVRGHGFWEDVGEEARDQGSIILCLHDREGGGGVGRQGRRADRRQAWGPIDNQTQFGGGGGVFKGGEY